MPRTVKGEYSTAKTYFWITILNETFFFHNLQTNIRFRTTITSNDLKNNGLTNNEPQKQRLNE